MPDKLKQFRPSGAPTRQEYNRQYNKTARDPELEKLYNSKTWRKCRLAFLQANPLCAHCLKEGKTAAAVIADHIIPLKQDRSDPFNWENLQPLCKPCHNRKTMKDKQ
jgi:5-methylcytosine-specific restriction protein A